MHGATPVASFLILGAPKCGTTALAEYLGQHPSVYLSDPKEPTFFEAEYDRGLDFYRDTYFRGWAGEAAAGEARVYHLYIEYVPERIRKSLPEAKLIAILRNPVTRAFSHWWHRSARAHEHRQFDELVEEELERIARDGPMTLGADPATWCRNLFPNTNVMQREPYVEYGYYATQLERYRALFPEEQIRVVFHDELARAPGAVVRDLLRFLEVDPDAARIDFRRRNVARRRQRGRVVGRLAQTSWKLGLNRIVPDTVRSGVVRALPAKTVERPAMSEAAAERLASHYCDHDDELERLLGRALPWRRRASAEPAAAAGSTARDG